jgi:hypothetical protein
MSFRDFLENSLQRFAQDRGIGRLDERLLGAYYSLSRNIFCRLCKEVDDHPRLIAVRAAGEAIDLLMQQWDFWKRTRYYDV